MNLKRSHRKLSVALLVAGSAILLLSCGGNTTEENEMNLEKLITQQTDTLTVYQSRDGKIKYKFEAPLMEYYEYARQPYTEFREGLNVTTYNDSTMEIESTLRANYGLVLEKQGLWEARGDVVATNARGQVLETQQLFWNEKTGRIYSNVDARITSADGGVINAEGFESDEEFREWSFRNATGAMEVDEISQQPEPNAGTDTVRVQNRPAGRVSEEARDKKPASDLEQGEVEEIPEDK